MEGSSLDLLSVICIETSHYVCFTKEPSEDPNKPHKWIFFDSMANRVCKLQGMRKEGVSHSAVGKNIVMHPGTAFRDIII
jgi:hypothetical protein